MVRLDATVHREAGVTLVAAVVENDGVRRRVALGDRCGGPVWPPRRRGVPVLDWQDGRAELVLNTGETRAVGYATPAPPAEPPLAVASTTPVVPVPTPPCADVPGEQRP